MASWSNSNKRTAERKVRCFTNPIPWVYVWVIQALGYLCTTYGGYYKTKILRTYIRQRPQGWWMAWKKEITMLSSRGFFTRTSCFTKEVLQRLALYRPYRMTPDRPHGRHDLPSWRWGTDGWLGSLSYDTDATDDRDDRPSIC